MSGERTIKCKHLRNLFFILSCLCWLGVVLYVIVSIGIKLEPNKEAVDILSEELKEKLLAFGTTAVIGLIVALFIKEKARTALYMISLVITVIINGERGMYIVLAVWAVDEYVLSALYKSYKQKYIINKEIDMR